MQINKHAMRLKLFQNIFKTIVFFSKSDLRNEHVKNFLVLYTRDGFFTLRCNDPDKLKLLDQVVNDQDS